jgi:hypothetical protein
MNSRSKSEINYAKQLPSPDESIVLNNDIPNLKLFEKKFNFSLLKVLKPSTRKSGATRVGGFIISKNQYDCLLDMGISHRFKSQLFLLTDFNVKTARLFSTNNCVVVQENSFQARLQKPTILKYQDCNNQPRSIQGSEFYLKFKFKKSEQIVKTEP